MNMLLESQSCKNCNIQELILEPFKGYLAYIENLKNYIGEYIHMQKDFSSPLIDSKRRLIDIIKENNIEEDDKIKLPHKLIISNEGEINLGNVAYLTTDFRLFEQMFFENGMERPESLYINLNMLLKDSKLMEEYFVFD